MQPHATTTRTTMSGTSAANRQQPYHIFAATTSSYSHALQTFGIIHRLLQQQPVDEFSVTLVTFIQCMPLVERLNRRLLENSISTTTFGASRLRVIPVSVSPATIQRLQEFYAKKLGNIDLFLDDKFDGDFSVFQAFVDAHDEPFRSGGGAVNNNNNDLLNQLTAIHASNPFNVAICDQLSLAAIEYADSLGIATLVTSWQSFPIPRDVYSNGVWMPYCTSDALRHRSPANDSFMLRIHAYYDYYIRYPNNVRMHEQLLRYAQKLRSTKPVTTSSSTTHKVIRRSYPRIDQRVSGTLLPAAYRRPDHCVCGPMWFDLTETFADLNSYTPNAFDKSQYALQVDTAATLKTWLDVAIEPVVFVSFGTTSRITPARMRLLMQALCSEQWLTLWKCDISLFNQILEEPAALDEKKKTDPKNTTAKNSNWRERARLRIRTVDWLPQLDVLRHPSVKLFITHAGSTSVLEAMACSVPMLCIPLAADQYYHAQRVAALGAGVRLDKRLATPEFLPAAIKRVLLSEPHYAMYKQNCLRIEAYHQSVSEVSRLSDFVRHFARFGYRYTELPDESYNWLQYWSYDVGLTVTAACALAVGGTLAAVYVLLQRTGVLGRWVRGFVWTRVKNLITSRLGLKSASEALEQAGEVVGEKVDQAAERGVYAGAGGGILYT